VADFYWKGVQHGKYADGSITAINKDEAAYLLRQDKVIITSLELISGKEVKKEKQKPETPKNQKAKSVPIKEVIVFTKKLETMMRSGLPVLETISMLKEQTVHPGMSYVIGEIQSDIERGVPLSEAFNKHPKVFDNVYINMLKAGESSGQIDAFMKRLVEGMEKTQAIKKKVKGALTYPTILLIVASIVITIMMIFVVPIFQDMFKGSEGGLPGPTQIVVNISDFIRDPMKGGVLLSVIVVSAFIFKLTLRNNIKFRRAFHNLVLKTPVIGNLIKNSSMAKIAMIQGNLTGAGVAVIEAIEIASKSVDYLPIQEAMSEVKRGVFSGAPLSELYQKYPDVFSKTFTAMVAVGERTGRMDEMFQSITNYYEEETDSSVDQLTASLEPIMIVFMGTTIGGILVAMYLPMFSMGNAIG